MLDQKKAARVVPRVSVISIEMPVRRRQGERFDPVEMDEDRGALRNARVSGSTSMAPVCFFRPPIPERPSDKTVAPVRHGVHLALQVFQTPHPARFWPDRVNMLEGMHHPRRMFGGGLFRACGHSPPSHCIISTGSANVSVERCGCLKT